MFRMLPAIFKAVKVNMNTGIMKGSDTVKRVDHPSIVRRIGDVQGYNMKVLFQSNQ
jgi:hypothetical protein